MNHGAAPRESCFTLLQHRGEVVLDDFKLVDVIGVDVGVTVIGRRIVGNIDIFTGGSRWCRSTTIFGVEKINRTGVHLVQVRDRLSLRRDKRAPVQMTTRRSENQRVFRQTI